jgi:molybdenum cofactor cytidylyltransferase
MISAIILAAGESKRMGRPKMLLPWGGTTVIQTVISAFQASGINDILVITGGASDQVEPLISDSVPTVFNENYKQGEMLSSIQAGLRATHQEAQAAFIALGDQPQIQVKTIMIILEAYEQTNASLIVPSFNMRRGHPWLVARELWEEIINMQPPHSAREFLERHARDIHYVKLDTPTVLQDLDTPEDYQKSQPENFSQNL